MTPDDPAQHWSAWPAPAKLNLFLHLVGRRDDGYHLLQTVFQLLDWGDTVHLRVRADPAIKRIGDIPGVAERDDLVVRAAGLLQQQAGSRDGVDIRVDKRIPIGGGLGGGSSDAATVLVALNRLWRCGLATAQLADLGARLGADVPVFVHGHSAFAEGVGDVLTPIGLPERDYLIVDPGVGVSTAALFQAPELTRDSAPMTIAGLISGVQTRNAFEPVARARFPAVAAALDWLANHGDARLSGSGAAVFVPLDGDAAQVIAGCPPGMRAWVARGVNDSPLLTALMDYDRKAA
ncbi:4-(cytidine 5'-diphospho)-2-C-methyl-D-erythritol kinase [Dokdonella sp.]|uniref:4-(cytidine 5'-diphospho)-2-C-methyl-D-erythritol kinase n=1 Tax=Dokdonella sp. TaxID=2291710 RepID=UPI002BA7F2CF|nr:4-(cytidine 5'-diphospho)-2-C-methyl-D-erythritol kinase [Dokdonella sp.]HOX72818.1 4-(cytidine 5'-diphospho)-2-C-methyl-D-erythritol kinase [Dokdonella sp.]HPN79125.1 4-(cytidine 5'-diphospho)-2-C-methyl-D-erythritol kinase [Dokdonella sp.]